MGFDHFSFAANTQLYFGVGKFKLLPGLIQGFGKNLLLISGGQSFCKISQFAWLFVQLGWQNIGEAVAGEVTVSTAMDNLAAEQDKIMERIERSGTQGDKGPKMNPIQEESYWLNQPGSPKPKLANEKPPGETLNYDQLIQAWKEGKVK